MVILGIDPGLQKTGWGIIKYEGNNLSYIASGTIRSDEKQEMPERLKSIYEGIRKVIDIYNPDEVAVEETFVNKNAMSSLKLGHARGAAIVAATALSVPVSEYAATLVKKSVVGVGRAEKDQVQVMIKHILPGAKADTSDAADALAVAICHANHSKSFSYLQKKA